MFLKRKVNITSRRPVRPRCAIPAIVIVRTWYQAGLRTKLTDVKTDTPVKITVKIRAPKSEK